MSMKIKLIIIGLGMFACLVACTKGDNQQKTPSKWKITVYIGRSTSTEYDSPGPIYQHNYGYQFETNNGKTVYVSGTVIIEEQ